MPLLNFLVCISVNLISLNTVIAAKENYNVSDDYHYDNHTNDVHDEYASESCLIKTCEKHVEYFCGSGGLYDDDSNSISCCEFFLQTYKKYKEITKNYPVQ